MVAPPAGELGSRGSLSSGDTLGVSAGDCWSPPPRVYVHNKATKRRPCRKGCRWHFAHHKCATVGIVHSFSLLLSFLSRNFSLLHTFSRKSMYCVVIANVKRTERAFSVFSFCLVSQVINDGCCSDVWHCLTPPVFISCGVPGKWENVNGRDAKGESASQVPHGGVGVSWIPSPVTPDAVVIVGFQAGACLTLSASSPPPPTTQRSAQRPHGLPLFRLLSHLFGQKPCLLLEGPSPW